MITIKQKNVTELQFEINLITSITEKKLGMPAGTLNQKKKTEPLVMGRMVVTNMLMDGGISPAKLAEHFCKHRTNYYHYRKQHNFYITNPKAYPEYNLLYESVLDEYDNRAHVSDLFRNRLAKLEVIDDIERALASLEAQKELLLKTV
tara:strand:- start:397 stop:840 length:444 start_codon:yes stop_codon:yes gene_type:complete